MLIAFLKTNLTKKQIYPGNSPNNDRQSFSFFFWKFSSIFMHVILNLTWKNTFHICPRNLVFSFWSNWQSYFFLKNLTQIGQPIFNVAEQRTWKRVNKWTFKKFCSEKCQNCHFIHSRFFMAKFLFVISYYILLV